MIKFKIENLNLKIGFLKKFSIGYAQANASRNFQFSMLLAALLLTGCIHQFPEMEENGDNDLRYEVTLRLTHDYSWGSSDFDLGTRSVDDGWQSRYVVRVFLAGSSSIPVYSDEVYADGVNPDDFSLPVSLPKGDWDVYIWKDNVREDRMLHNVSDFGSIGYSDEYCGADDRRETLEGIAAIKVDGDGEHEVAMCRPQSKYVFVATNFRQFFEDVLLKSDTSEEMKGKSWSELTEMQKEQLLSGYSIVGIYPLFMPSVYNMYSRKIIDSARGVSFETAITPIDDDTAVLAFDHVFIGEADNAVQVQLALKTPEGATYQLTSTVTVPLRRGEITYAKGDILRVPQGSGGVEIEMDFSGEFNIHI